MFYLKNPVPESVVDKEQISKEFQKYKIVPYYGTTSKSSHTFLKTLNSLTELSGSFSAVVNDLETYAFGHALTVTALNEPGLDLEVPEVSPNVQSRFYDYLKERNIKAPKLLSISCQILRSLKASGNAWLIVRRSSVMDAVRYDIQVEPFTNVAYLKQSDFEDRVAIITPVWNDPQFWRKSPPKIRTVTEQDETIIWNDAGDGIQEALIHFRRPGTSKYYGRPEILSVLNWLYVDYVLSDLEAKVAGTELVSKKIIAFQERSGFAMEDDRITVGEKNEVGEDGNIGTEVEDDFRRTMKQLKALTTRVGDHGETSAIVGIEYPAGTNSPTVLDLEISRDEKHHNFLKTAAEQKIAGILGWSPELSGLVQSKTNIGGNILKDLFIIKNSATIIPEQVAQSGRMNWLISEIMDFEQAPAEIRDLGFSFGNVVEQIVEDLSGEKNEDLNLPTDPVADPETE